MSHQLLAALQQEIGFVRQRQHAVDFDIAEYEQLDQRLHALVKETLQNGLETMSELGAGVWIHSRIPDTSHITLDLGLGIHMDMKLDEAADYVCKKIEVVKMKRDALSVKEEYLVWQAGQVQALLRP